MKTKDRELGRHKAYTKLEKPSEEHKEKRSSHTGSSVPPSSRPAAADSIASQDPKSG